MPATIVALHAAAVTPAMWDEVRQAAPDLEFLAPDLIALTERGDGTLAHLVQDLAAQLPEGPLVLLGASIGAHIALELAAVLGDRVRGTVMVAPGPPTLDAEFLERARGLERIVRHAWSPAVGKSLIPLLVYPFGPDYATIAARVERMLALAAERSATLLGMSPALHRAAELLPLVSGPVRVLIAGANSNPVVGVGLAEAWRGVLGSAVEKIPDASEFLPMEKPDAVVDAIRALLEERPAARLRS
ncbi:alpha/beta fold hydrolase [Vulgatibacter sp.]|uniref:alpha/beta fold hydrolase n=1 Tax=Vulgatibacter sp. TaxID=1971226 RepID=UPI003561FA5D